MPVGTRRTKSRGTTGGQKQMESSTQRVLSNAYLLHEIFSMLASDSTTRKHSRHGARDELEPAWAFPVQMDRTQRSALVHAAVTCKAFSSPALDALWRVMFSIVPLFSILPGFKAHEEARYPYEHRYSLSEAIQEEHWTRLNQYARRVRYLCCSISPKMDEFMFIFLLPHLKGTPLLPCLRSLSFPCSPVLLILVASTLRDVNIASLGDKGTSSFLPALLDSAPLLENLSSPSTSKELSPDAWKTLRQFHNLRTLHLGSRKYTELFALDGFGEIFSLGQLVELSLFFDKLDPSVRLKPKPGSQLPQSFSLRVLKIRATPLFVGDVLECISTAPLQTLQITYQSSSPDLLTGVESCPISFLPLSQWPESLVHLELQDGSSYIHPGRPSKDLSFLQPLHSLKKLATVSIVMSSLTFDLPDDAWGEIAHWWPDIQKLWIIGDRVERPRARFPTLEAFALHCPKLSDLSLWLDLCAPSASPLILSHRLQRLSVEKARVGDSHRVARHLDCLFPSLGLAVGSYDYDEYARKRWEDIEDILKTCQLVRLDHETRLLAS